MRVKSRQVIKDESEGREQIMAFFGTNLQVHIMDRELSRGGGKFRRNTTYSTLIRKQYRMLKFKWCVILLHKINY